MSASLDLRVYKNCFDRVRCCKCRSALPKDINIYYNRFGARGQKQYCMSCGTAALNGRVVDIPAQPVDVPSDVDIVDSDVPESIASLPAETGDSSSDLARAIASAVSQHIKPSLDENRVLQLIAKHAPKPTANVQTIEVLNYKSDSIIDLGIQHKQFPDLLQEVQARDHKGNMLNFWLVGAPGDGKTTACESVAKALGVDFVTVPTMSSSHIFFGYRAVGTGEYIASEARRIWEFGGVLILDDFDATPSDVAVELNAPLANGYCLFSDKMVPRHKDCVIMLTANTWGSGATADFVGRNKQDEAFINRFVQVYWQIDEALETATCGNEAWAKRVQSVRRKVATAGIKVFVTPRASYQGAALLRQGVPQARVELRVLRGRMTDAQWSSVC